MKNSSKNVRIGRPKNVNEKNAWGLNYDEELFAIEYFTTLNATQSYMKIRPDLTYMTAQKKGMELKNKPEVKEFLAHLMDTVRNDRIMTAEEVLVGLSDIARGDDSDLGRHQKIYVKDKVKALELMAKHYLLLTDVSKQEIDQKVTIVDDLGGEMLDE